MKKISSQVISGKEFIENKLYRSNEYSAYMVYITPEDAKFFLDNLNEKNRRCSVNTVASYADQMKNGKWIIENGTTFSFDKYGNLTDAQHRCRAIIESGISLLTCVVVGCQESSFYVIDSGKMRSLGDILSIEKLGKKSGYTNEKEIADFESFVAKTLKQTISGLNGSISEHGNKSSRKQAISNIDSVEFFSANKSLFINAFDSINSARQMKGYSLFPQKKLFGILAVISQIKGYDINIINKFFSTLFGTNYGEIQPIMELREYITSSRNKNRNWNITRVWNAYVSSFNAFVENKSVKITDKRIEEVTVVYLTTTKRKKETITLEVVEAK